MKAEILCIGTELLIGQVVNTNATWLGQELAALGVSVMWVTTVGDNFARLEDALKRAAQRADLVITTGGLGPTDDDITHEAIANVLGEALREFPEARAHVEHVFARTGRPMVPSNLKQALFPANAALIPNPAGTAPGCEVKASSGAQIWTFPGVPRELKAMFTAWARPRLAAADGGTIHSVLLRFAGIGESALAEQVRDLLSGENPTVAPYAGDWEVHLRVTARAASRQAAESMMAPILARLRGLAPYYYGDDDVNLPAAVGVLLHARGETIATAESCTGGLLASRLTDVVGASNWVKGGIVAYQVPVKTDLLGVKPAQIEQNGVVSEAVAATMAEGVRASLASDWGVGITGWAGTSPDVPQEDWGMVWIAVAGPGGTVASLQRYGPLARETIKLRATQSALDLLRLQLNRAATQPALARAD